jgi:hypothetical protein
MQRTFRESTDEGVAAHVPSWRKAWLEAGASLYLSPEWVLSLWESHAEGRGVDFTFRYEGERLVAVLPLVRTLRWKAGVPFVHFGLLTNCYGQNHNELIAFGSVRPAAETLLALLEGRKWDVFEFTSVPVDSPSMSVLGQLASDFGLSMHLHDGVVSPFISLGPSWEVYLSGRSSNFRSDIRRKGNKWSDAGLLVEEVNRVEAVESALNEIMRIETKSWKQEAGTSIPNQELAVRFYRSFLRRAAGEGWLRIFLAKLGGRAIAYDMGIQLFGKYYMLKTGFEEEFGSLSPGNFIRQHVLKRLIAERVGEHDFLGDADAYKLRWTSDQRRHAHIYLWNKARFRSKVYLFARSLRLSRSDAHPKVGEVAEGGERTSP